jgi:hypothetical protein
MQTDRDGKSLILVCSHVVIVMDFARIHRAVRKENISAGAGLPTR